MSHPPLPTARLILAGLALLLCVRPSHAQERFYLAVFAAESTPYRPKNTHTFATAVRVDGDRVESHTISWLPVALKLRPLALRSEEGANLSLEDSVAWCHGNGMFVSVWGPYEVTPDLYRRFVERKAHLDSGAVRYRVASKGHPARDSADCAHAMEPITEHRNRQRYIGPFGFGEPAAAYFVGTLTPWLVQGGCERWEVMEMVGVAQLKLVRRAFDYRPTRHDSWGRAVGR